MAIVSVTTDAHGEHYILRPSRASTRNIGVIWAPGTGQLAEDVLTDKWGTNLQAQTELIVALGEEFTVFVGDLDGNSTFGNATGAAAMTAARTNLISAGCESTVVVVGLSHGHVAGVSWAAANPTFCRGVVGIIPGCNLQQVRVTNYLGARAAIDAAWSVTYPAALPTNADHSLVAHAETADKAAVLKANGTPWRAYAGIEDVAVLIGDARTFAANYGNRDALVQVNGDHDDTTIGDIDPDELCGWIAALDR